MAIQLIDNNQDPGNSGLSGEVKETQGDKAQIVETLKQKKGKINVLGWRTGGES